MVVWLGLSRECARLLLKCKLCYISLNRWFVGTVLVAVEVSIL